MNLRANSGPMAALTRPGHFAAPRAERAIALGRDLWRTSRMTSMPPFLRCFLPERGRRLILGPPGDGGKVPQREKNNVAPCPGTDSP